jgi:hypothetical protein
VAECTGLENRRPRKGPVGSNPTPSAGRGIRQHQEPLNRQVRGSWRCGGWWWRLRARGAVDSDAPTRCQIPGRSSSDKWVEFFLGFSSAS